MNNWRFDDTDPAGVWFDEDLTRFAPMARAAVERALVELLDEEPMKNPKQVVQGEIVYIKRVLPDLVEGELIPALLLTYRVSGREQRIRKLAIYLASETAPNGPDSTDAEMMKALEGLIARALRRAKGRDH